MDDCADNDNYAAIQMELNEESDESIGSDNDSSFERNSTDTESYTLLRNKHANKTDLIYRRISNYMGDSRFFTELSGFHIFSSAQKSTRQNKSMKRFLFIFGFASTLLILSQIYLTLYFDGSYDMSLLGWERNRNRSVPFYILPDENTTILEPSKLCKEQTPILLLIVICSAPYNFEIRQTLRETWANTTEFNYSKFAVIHSHLKGKYLPINYADRNIYTVKKPKKISTESSQKLDKDDLSNTDFQIRIVFLVGQTENNETQDQIVDESRKYNDLIQESFLDTYNNLTLKSVMMLKWIHNNCAGKVKFVMKCDDDTFVNVPNLIHFLLGGTIPVYNVTLHRFDNKTIQILSPKNRLRRSKELLIGVRFCHSRPISDYHSKWYTPRYMYNKKIYPIYLSGTGYVFSIDVAKKLYNASLEAPLLHLEDVFLTGICAENAHIKPQDYHLFNYLPYKDLCEVNGMITSHEIKSNDMKIAYDFIMKSNVTCSAPGKKLSVRPHIETSTCS